MAKDPLKKLFVDKLEAPFYLNVVQFSYCNGRKSWSPMFYSKWAGSDRRSEAVRLRKEASAYLHEKGSDTWRDGVNIKTVKVSLYQ